MPAPTPARPTRRRSADHPATRLRAVLVALLTVTLGAVLLTAAGGAGPASAATDDPVVEQPGTSPSVDETPSTSDPSPRSTATYGEGGAGPHQESGEDQLGPLTPGRTLAIVAILVVTAGIITALAVRARRQAKGTGHRS
ncbi:hypothetical protein [Cellulomonas fimi]|uniref:Uncharacterized protein n=1 Tax=Cellulomonas fimi (strain ATCC 484 / DSM 20113 / JCM 1341 / CCUG 24087 / LMG 16345 / NBRC 15513 / NCIMB 8980 / NCTC 7547 / NRS-133) TaxID=590998 RepID=F4H408_CELFA|nr:hypothetical protein [Cellulomonas fimi]AEE45360.1 hypothetical protein Celf_1225 [Cellulomonas fimi ATCC 484]NNH08160.1 hypothetical protein [Cellulomonas fimi]VEH29102.1 Uncharacterised protein [Cellulomonas fimi]